MLKASWVLYFVSLMTILPRDSFSVSSLGSDLTLLFDCEAITDDHVVSQFESFLSDNGYQHLDVSKVRREAGVNADRVYIVGLYHNYAIVTVLSFLRENSGYAFTLQTQPPTRRDVEFEGRILKFVEFGIGCNIRQLDRSYNKRDSLEFFNREVRRIEGWFGQSDVLKSR